MLAGVPARAELLSVYQPPLSGIQQDSDGDGIGDLDELAIGTNPTNPDDGWADDDGDGLSIAWEFYLGTDSLRMDSDSDGYADGAEVFIYLTDPLDAQSHPMLGFAAGFPDGAALALASLDVELAQPKLANGDFSATDFNWWRDGTKMTDYLGGGYKWNYGSLPGWTPYVGTKVEVWSVGGENFIELDATTGSYGIKQPIADVRAGHYVVSWRQLGRKSSKAEKNSFKVILYYLQDGVEKLVGSPFVVASVPTDQWRENACSFHLGAAQLAAANGAPIHLAFIPTGTLNSYGTLIDKVELGLVEVRDGTSLLAALPLDQDPWTNENLQRTIPAESIAWITGNSGANGSPEMPMLNVRLTGTPASVMVQWRFECEYRRGNGYRQPYVADFTRAEDRVGIPGQSTLAFTDPLSATSDWNIHESEMWQEELRDRGFFGGLAKVFLKLGTAPETEVSRFRIGGQNPDPAAARTFIDAVAGPNLWFAYAIAKHETFGRIPGRFYNQFYTNHQPASGKIGPEANDMGWVAWANGWPLYNLDRSYSSSRGYRQNGPGGYGIFQLTLGPKSPDGSQAPEAFIARRQIWNWQDNCQRAIQELQDKFILAKRLESSLEKAYPAWPKITEATYGRFNGLDAITITYYNGMAGRQIERVLIGNKTKIASCWKPVHPSGSGASWRFLQNQNDYVQSINSHIE